jgi:hypothetical protein
VGGVGELYIYIQILTMAKKTQTCEREGEGGRKRGGSERRVRHVQPFWYGHLQPFLKANGSYSPKNKINKQYRERERERDE